jgi:chromosome segregation protein
MKDITELFNGTGLGKKGYSIINQGELELVLNGQAIDRRLMLEEAANIAKYRQQRDEVNRRLEHSQRDLLRVADLMAELKQRCEELKIKADRARQWMELSREQQIKEPQFSALNNPFAA